MKKVTLRMALLVAGLFTIIGTWADVVAPTLPTFVAPESGGTYYIYNVESGQWLTNTANSTYYVGIGVQGRPVQLTNVADTTWTMYFADNTNYGYIYSTDKDYIRTNNSYSGTSTYCTWNIQATGNDYYIRRSPKNKSYYAADEYVGWGGSSTDYVYANRKVDEAVHWKFATEEAGVRYFALKQLYDAIEATKIAGYAFSLSPYEAIYSNSASTNEELINAAQTLTNALTTSSGYIFPDWNESLIFLEADAWYSSSNDDNYYHYWELYDYKRLRFYSRYNSRNPVGTAHRLKATLSVTEPSVFIYEMTYSQSPFHVYVYVDGVLTQDFNSELCSMSQDYSYAGSHDRFFEELDAGVHSIVWEIKRTAEWEYRYDHDFDYNFYMYNIGCIATPEISVSLLEPGSLGTEVLYQTDHIKNVRKLKVKGAMNDDDWNKIQMMSSLYSLDLSEAITDHVPAKQFYGGSETSAARFLHKVVVPETIETIGNNAFDLTFIEEFNFPQACTEIGAFAFATTHLKEAILPDNLENLGGNSNNSNNNHVFYNCHLLEKVSLGKKLEAIGYRSFSKCWILNELFIPESVTKIYDYAFENCGNYRVKLPSHLTYIGNYAFYQNYSLESITIPPTVTYIGYYAFSRCSNLKYAELPVEMFKIDHNGYAYYDAFSGCSSLETLRLYSTTVVELVKGYTPIDDSYRSNIKLEVPSYLVNSYKLDQYWYNYKSIEGFDPSTIDYWPIHNPLTLNARERFGGNPSIKIYEGNYLKINGETEQQFNNVEVDYRSSSFLSNCNNLSINGSVKLWYYTESYRWYFISLPFDMRVSDISVSEGTQYAIRYYDGANRAVNGAVGSWKNYGADDVIPAGTGFIYQTNQKGWTTSFLSMDNESKQNIVSNAEFVKSLTYNASADVANAGWNLVGNPYQTYYNNHMLNFTAPITVWDLSARSYKAYSLTDDDYALSPNEAFFVQCPENPTSISFPLQGRQINDVIESQNAAPQHRAGVGCERQIVEIALAGSNGKDQTRIVLNEQASAAYEMNCDASKFMSMEVDVPQLYTLDADDTPYAINERPEADGRVILGFYAGEDGSYTISLPRCDAKSVYLEDRQLGVTVCLNDGDYNFTSKAGTFEARFTLTLRGGTTGIQSPLLQEEQEEAVFDLTGRCINTPTQGVYIRNGKKILVK